MELLKRPKPFDPYRRSLEIYLRFAARRNLYDLMRTERRSVRNGKNGNPLQNFSALGSAETNIKCSDRHDPSIELMIRETIDAIHAEFDRLRASLTSPDDKVLDLMISGTRKTEAYANVLGVLDWNIEEKVRLVKLAKERVKYRIERDFHHLMELFRFK